MSWCYVLPVDMKAGQPLPEGVYYADAFFNPAGTLKDILARFRNEFGKEIFQKTVFEALEYELGTDALYKACGDYRSQTQQAGARKRNDDRSLVKMGQILAAGLETELMPVARLVIKSKDENSTTKSAAARLVRKFKERDALYRNLGEVLYCEEKFLELTGYYRSYIFLHDRTPLDQLHHDDPVKAEEAEAIIKRYEAAWRRPIPSSWPQLPREIAAPGKRGRGRPRKTAE
jgi:hypothetical protein